MTSTLDMLAVRQRSIAEQQYLVLKLVHEGAKVHGEEPPIKQVTYCFSAGLLIRHPLESNIRQFLDLEGIDYELRKYPGWLTTDFHLVIRFRRWEDVAVYATLLGAMRAQMEAA